MGVECKLPNSSCLGDTKLNKKIRKKKHTQHTLVETTNTRSSPILHYKRGSSPLHFPHSLLSVFIVFRAVERRKVWYFTCMATNLKSGALASFGKRFVRQICSRDSVVVIPSLSLRCVHCVCVCVCVARRIHIFLYCSYLATLQLVEQQIPVRSLCVLIVWMLRRSMI